MNKHEDSGVVDKYVDRRVPVDGLDRWQLIRKGRSWHILMMIKNDGKVEEDAFVAQVSVLNGIRVSKVREYVESYVKGGFVRRDGKWLVWNEDESTSFGPEEGN